MTSIFDTKLKETIETLAGTRSHGNKERAAVRYEDLAAILRYRPKLQAETVTAAPTAEQHNALVRDLQSINTVLTQLSEAIAKKQGNQ